MLRHDSCQFSRSLVSGWRLGTPTTGNPATALATFINTFIRAPANRVLRLHFRRMHICFWTNLVLTDMMQGARFGTWALVFTNSGSSRGRQEYGVVQKRQPPRAEVLYMRPARGPLIVVPFTSSFVSLLSRGPNVTELRHT
jgi:hypothetical protein